MIGSSVNKFSVVIPLIPQHDRELARIFKELKNSEENIKEIIICRSETLIGQKRTIESMKRRAEKSGIDPELLRFSFVSGKATAGENRNRGWNLASGSFVAFLDADDSYISNRLEVLGKVLEKSNAKAVLHKYRNSSNGVNQIQDPAFAVERIMLNKAGIFSTKNSQVSFHCAHLTLDTSLRNVYQYTDMFPGEDLELVTRLITDGAEVLHIDYELSSWNRNRSPRYEIRRMRKKILSLKFRR
jgi:glycosyltransferase involved in cell wall biosynthesis